MSMSTEKLLMLVGIHERIANPGNECSVLVNALAGKLEELAAEMGATMERAERDEARVDGLERSQNDWLTRLDTARARIAELEGALREIARSERVPADARALAAALAAGEEK